MLLALVNGGTDDYITADSSIEKRNSSADAGVNGNGVSHVVTVAQKTSHCHHQ
jgi:hypothetical protein